MKLKWDNDWVSKQITVTFKKKQDQEVFLDWLENSSDVELEDYKRMLVETARMQLMKAYQEARQLASCDSLNTLLSETEANLSPEIKLRT